MSLTDEITAYGAARYGSQGEQTPTDAAIVQEETVLENNTPTEVTTEIVETPPAPAEASIAPVEAQTPDYNTILEEISGGMFKDLESFKSSLPKIQEYDAVVAQKTELEAKLPTMVTPANDFVKALNDMHINGATTDQIKSFIRLNEVEDLSKLSPIDIKVHKLVHEGYGEDIARKIVAMDFPLDDLEEGSDERLVMEEKLKISAAVDLKAIEGFKKELSSIGQDKIQEQETARLNALAIEEGHKREVSLAVPKIAETMVGLGERVLIEGGENVEPIKISYNYPDSFKKDIPQLLNDFFVDYKLPVTQENIEKANQYVSAVYWDANRDSLLQSAAKHVEAVVWERAVNKYENRSGLPTETPNQNIVDVNADRSNFLNSVANRQTIN